MSPVTAKVCPFEVQYRISANLAKGPVDHDGWSALRRKPVTETIKGASIVMRYRDGARWEETPLFRESYRARLSRGQSVRGCRTMAAITENYYTRVDGLFRDLKDHGFRQGHTSIPVYVGRDGAMMLGIQGNHRIVMSHVLGLSHVWVDVVARHPDAA